MSLFLVLFAALVALALLLLLPTLMRSKALRAPDASAPDARRANLQVLREQLAALDAEHAAGTLDAEQHRLARIEIERRALEEEQAPAPVLQARANKTAVVLGVSIPLFALVLYALLGDPQAMLPASQRVAANGQGEVTAEQIAGMVETLSKRLESKSTTDPADLQAWTMLARSYVVLQRYPEAARAYARARTLAPNDAQLLADNADALAMAQNQRLAGEPTQMIAQALELDPRNTKVLALAGSAAFERSDFAGAIRYWEQAEKIIPPGTEFAAGLKAGIAQARAAQSTGAAAGVSAGASSALGAQGAAEPVAKAAAAAQGAAKISGVVQLAGNLSNKVQPDDTLFVFARAAQGPRMPLAILKRKVSDLPLAFTLDDSSAMSPEMRLSNFHDVVIGARISRSGDAMPHSGDLVGQLGPLATGSNKLVLVIDAVQP